VVGVAGIGGAKLGTKIFGNPFIGSGAVASLYYPHLTTSNPK